jgi:exodeoxyribonuclease V gamma subunit
MNDGAFPRGKWSLGFDLTQRAFRPGDRSRRADDRYLFLETLMSVRDRLIISYQGFSQRDNSVIPPCVVVDELRDCLLQMLGEAGLEAIIRHHPLQPFSTAYFLKESRLFSYSPEMREAALALGQGSGVDQALLRQPLLKIPPETVIELDQLYNFFQNPQRSFAKERLKINLEPAQWLPDEREIFCLDHFGRIDLGNQWVEHLLRGQTFEDVFDLYDARGLLPHGNPGQMVFEELIHQAQIMKERLADYHKTWLAEPLPVCLSLAAHELRGQLYHVNTSGLVAYTIGGFYPYQLIKHWIRHLVLNQMAPQGVRPETRLLEADREGRFKPVKEPEALLEALIKIRQQGLQTVLSFYPGTAWKFVEKLKQGDKHKALKSAQDKWFGNQKVPGDADKPYHRLLKPQGPALNHDFEAITLEVLVPLLNHLEW